MNQSPINFKDKLKSVFLVLMMPLILLTMAVFLQACGSGGSNSNGESTGTLNLSMVDATTDVYQAIYVTVSEVQVNQSIDEEEESGWITVSTPNRTINLLELVNGVREDLGEAELEAGQYHQMRLILGNTPDDEINILFESHPYANYLIKQNNEIEELKVPSGLNTGIKIVNNFEISENETTELVLDFDATASVVVAGNSGQYILKPTIKILNTVEASSVSGFVADSTDLGLGGVIVSAQQVNVDAENLEDEVIVITSTITEADGSYFLFLSPGNYNIVTYKEGYEFVVQQINLLENEAKDLNFTLDTTLNGSVSGSVDLVDQSDETYSVVSIRDTVAVENFSDTETRVEIYSVNIANGGSFEISLPEGDYDLSIDSINGAYLERTFNVTSETNTSINTEL